jgi:putative endonuclease
MRQFWIYILASASRVLYTGVTNDLAKRLVEHRTGITKGFADRYNCKRLVYYEVTEDAIAAITREKQIKGWVRRRKIALIEAINPDWKDLSEQWSRESRDPSSLCSSG